MNKKNFLIIGLVIIVMILFQYILFDKINTSQQEKLMEQYQIGYDDGTHDAVVTILKNTDYCQIGIVGLENVTRNLLDYNCISTNPSEP